MMMKRSAGVLLHPTSLPGPYGIGDLGPSAYEWVDFLAKAGFSWWQTLPVGPTGYGHSPYQSYSSFAGNFMLISLDRLVEMDLLTKQEIEPPIAFPEDYVDFAKVLPYKLRLITLAASRFVDRAAQSDAYQSFCKRNSAWLPDYALFISLKKKFGEVAWVDWPQKYRDRDLQIIAKIKQERAVDIESQSIVQFFFDQQWKDLREYASAKGIGMIGDIPIYVAHDSVDVWINRGLFQLDADGQLTALAGVPPDYFTETGQLWGNPLYRWEIHAQDDFAWWRERLAHSLQAFDYVRLDHFRGFAGYWSVPAGEETAKNGQWIPGPGHAFFEAMQRGIAPLAILAEDLGEITPDVIELRNDFDLPSMKILQFAFFDGLDHDFLPHNYPENAVVYTGTHDHDTSRGWFESAEPQEQAFALHYLKATPETVIDNMVEAALKSVARLAAFPLQDLLDLGTEARMNEPGTLEGNWLWRMRAENMNQDLQERMKRLNSVCNR